MKACHKCIAAQKKTGSENWNGRDYGTAASQAYRSRNSRRSLLLMLMQPASSLRPPVH